MELFHILLFLLESRLWRTSWYVQMRRSHVVNPEFVEWRYEGTRWTVFISRRDSVRAIQHLALWLRKELEKNATAARKKSVNGEDQTPDTHQHQHRIPILILSSFEVVTFLNAAELMSGMAEKLNGMQIITFVNVKTQKRGSGLSFTQPGLEVNMLSNYISVCFNYVSAREARRQRKRNAELHAYKWNIWNKDRATGEMGSPAASGEELWGKYRKCGFVSQAAVCAFNSIRRVNGEK